MVVRVLDSRCFTYGNSTLDLELGTELRGRGSQSSPAGE